jgi:glycosyltransferase involved in cell wall biosynthesis
MHDNQQKITAVIIAKNEEANIGRTLIALKNKVDEIIVCDTGSTDNTVQIAQKEGATIVSLIWEGYAVTKNKANQLAKNDWILSIDADEVLSESLAEEIRCLEVQKGQVYAFDRLNYFAQKYVRAWSPDWKIRIFHRGDVCWQGNWVHEKLEWESKMTIVRLKNKLYHYSYTSTQDYYERMERYTDLAAKSLWEQGKKPNFIKRYLGAYWVFFKFFIIKGSWRDGSFGWQMARLGKIAHQEKYKKLLDLWKKNLHFSDK